MSRQRRGLRERTDGRARTSNPAAERRDGLLYRIERRLLSRQTNHELLSTQQKETFLYPYLPFRTKVISNRLCFIAAVLSQA